MRASFLVFAALCLSCRSADIKGAPDAEAAKVTPVDKATCGSARVRLMKWPLETVSAVSAESLLTAPPNADVGRFDGDDASYLSRLCPAFEKAQHVGGPDAAAGPIKGLPWQNVRLVIEITANGNRRSIAYANDCRVMKSADGAVHAFDGALFDVAIEKMPAELRDAAKQACNR